MSKISREGLWSALKALLAALPLLAIAFVYFLARGTNSPVLGLDPAWLRTLLLLELLAILYVSAGNDFRGDAFKVANYRGFVPRITYASYLGSEGLLAFFLVPITWWTITVAMRRSRGEELRSSG